MTEELGQISSMHSSRVLPRGRQFGWMSYILIAVVVYIFYMLMSAKPRPPSGFAMRDMPIMDVGNMPGGMAAVLPVDTADQGQGSVLEQPADKAEVSNALTADEKSLLRDVLPTMDRVVHLDLKGAAPKVSYLEKLFPLFKKLGASGLLIEWEDTFPYEGELETIAAEDCYSKDQVQQIMSLAKQNDLFVIPLIQSFGHMEFVLKGEKFKHLREIPDQPQVINPHKPESMTLINAIIDQQMKLQPDVQYFHIGCDEVWGLGDSPESKEQMERYGMTKEIMFLNHVREVAGYVKNNYPHVEIMMWDDMFRSVKAADIEKSKVNRLVTPIVWKYTRDLSQTFKADLWTKYGKLFHSMWFGSAFKGATGSDMFITDISHHYDNHMPWLKILSSIASGTANVRGTIITGWQRYDHFATLCELLPVGIPSLAVCLSTLQHAGINKKQLNDINGLLGCLPHLPIQWSINTKDKPPPMCSYTGHRVLEGVYALKNANHYVAFFESKQSLSGWHKDFHMNRGFAQTFRMKYMLEKCTKASEHISNAEQIMREQLPRYFSEDTAAEWIETNIQPVKDLISKKKAQVDRALSTDTWPRRPLHNKPIS